MKNISELMTNYLNSKRDNESKKNLQRWQVWTFEFCEKYKIEKEDDIKSILFLVSKYRNALNWFEWLDGYLSDYPNLTTPPIGLVFYLFKKYKDEGTFKNVKLHTPNQVTDYRKIRNRIKRFKKKNEFLHNAKNRKLINEFVRYHRKFLTKPRKNTNIEKHKYILQEVNNYKHALIKGAYMI